MNDPHPVPLYRGANIDFSAHIQSTEDQAAPSRSEFPTDVEKKAWGVDTLVDQLPRRPAHTKNDHGPPRRDSRRSDRGAACHWAHRHGCDGEIVCELPVCSGVEEVSMSYLRHGRSDRLERRIYVCDLPAKHDALVEKYKGQCA